ncbi:MAG: LysR family transcriptional regulator [Peptoniphilaceae bacterium]|nr:LysR family transcriptional regulator [Peptoniphilaceae bacterium]MDY6018277.1 LysR family transcriptional regulator [Anaerococcus sp.]
MSATDYVYISAILEAGSITDASKKLFISQSALSQYIKRIEVKLGIEIFDRNFSPLRLTQAGDIFYRSLADIVAIEKETLQQIEDLNNLKRGEVVIGSTDYLSYSLLSKVLKKFNEKYPGIDIRLLEGKTSDINQAALEGKCDFSLSYKADQKPELTNIWLYQEEVYIALPIDNKAVKELNITYPQKEIPTIAAKYLKGNNIIGMKKGQNLRSIYNQLNRFTDNSLKTIIETDYMSLAMKFVSEGVGIALVPSGMAMENRLECIFVKTKPALNSRTIMIHYNSTRKLKKPAEILMKMLEEYVRENFYKREKDEL